MKHTNTFRRLMSLLLIAAMLLSMAVVGSVGVFAADNGLTLSYNFKYKNAGYAEGQVTLSADSASDYGNYTFYWADDTKALEGYAPITTLNLNKESASFNFREFTAIPAGATKLIATKSAKTVAGAAAVYDIPADKQFMYADSEKEYNFQTLSDIHFHNTNYYSYAEAHFASALNAAALRGAEFVSTCGDNTNYCDDKEWGMYLSTLANSDFTGPVYEVNGNHEPYGKDEINSANQQNLLTKYKYATGLGVNTEKLGSQLYYEVTAPNGDHHIYMALELVNNKYHPGISDNFTKAQIDWLEGLLNKYKNDGKKIFIYEHAPFARYGAGDNKVTPHYEAAMTINKDLYPQTYRFKELLEANKNIVWFSGHTHIDFKYNYNIDNENGTTAYTVHVPSTASTTTVNASNGLDYVNKADSAQGYFVDVYKDVTVINGTDLVKNEILPLYTYLVDYSGDKQSNDDYTEAPTTPSVEPTNPPYTGETVNVYFTNNKNWSDVYIYGFYGVEGGTATGEPLGTYPGTKMTLVGKNDMSQDVYTAAVPADIDYIKFSDGSATNNRTNNIPNTAVAENAGFYITDSLGSNKWGYGTYEYVATAKADVAEVGAGVTVYAINSAKWDVVSAYYWGGVDVSWPGTAMTKTGETVNGFDVYSITLDAAPQNIIFNNNNNGSQTGDLTFQAGKYYDIKAGVWYNSLSDVPGVDVLGTDRYLVGDFNGWSTVANEFKLKAEGETIGYVEMELDAHTTYEFKIVREGVWTSCKETLQITETSSGLTFSSSVGDNAKITTKDAGVYTFAFGVETSQLAVTYPTAASQPTEPAPTTPVPTTPAPTDPTPTEPTPTESVPADPTPVETVKIFFTNNNGWENVYIYGFYGVEGGTATGEPLGTYPGTKMTFVEKNGFDQDIYSAEVPADIDYIKFADGTASNNRTNNIPKTEIADNTGFYITDNLGGTKWGYGAYEYVPTEPDTTVPETTVPEVSEDEPTEPEATTPDETVPTEPETTVPETNTITIYFSNNNGWENVYIYGFYGVEGGAATGEPLGTYPGTKMTFVEKNGYGQDVYSAEVPADIDYIKFADGTASNNRTNNIPKTEIADNTGFYITDSLGGTKWGYGAYEYAPTEPNTTVPAATDDSEPVTTVPTEIDTTAAPTEVDTTAAPTEPAVTLLYGDADQNGMVNVKDATAIQKHIADLYMLTDAGYAVSDVDANDNVNVKDVTMIQKFVADLIDRFPAQDVVKPTEPETTAPTEPETTAPTTPQPTDPPVSSTELSKLVATVGTTLANENYYASYVAYAGLKKVYFEYKDANVAESEEAAAIAEINAALSDYNTMKKNNPNHVPAYSAPKPGTYVVHGNFTGSWIDHKFEVTGTNTNLVSFTIDLAPGTYKFVINESGTDNWYKNGGTINDTCSAWIYGTSGADTTFVATGGTYKFQFTISSKALTVTKQ